MRGLRTPAPVAALLALAVACCCAGNCSSDDPIGAIEDRREVGSRELMDLLQQGSREERLRAAVAMGRIQHVSYAADLAAAAADEDDPGLRKAALFALGQLGLAVGRPVPDVAVRTATAALDDPAAEIVATAVEALGKLAVPRSAEPIAGLVEHPSAQVRAEAASALFRLQFVPIWRGESDEPPTLPAGAVAALLRLFDDEDPDVRTAAVHAFARYGQTGAAAALASRLQDDVEWVRLFAARALGRSGDATRADALATALGDASFRVRSEAVTALAALGETRRLHEGLVEDPAFQVRAAAATAWGAADGGPFDAALERLAADSSVTVRAAALRALAARRGASYAATLERFLDDEAWPIRRTAAEAARDAGEARRQLVARAWADGDHRVRTAAVESADTGSTEGWAVVLAALETDDVALRGTALARLEPGRREGDRRLVVEAWERSRGAAWIEVRESAAGLLADDPGAEAALRRIARTDSAASVRSRARAALERRGVTPDAAPPPAPPRSPYLGSGLAADPIVTLETTKGTLRLRCFAADAPIHVAQFLDLVRDGFYDGLIWHRVVSNFVVQGGDPRGDGWGQGDTVLRDEINRRRFVRGAVGMPKAGKDTGGCQLFITHVPTPHLDGNYTVFAQVDVGLDVIDRLEVGDVILRASVH